MDVFWAAVAAMAAAITALITLVIAWANFATARNEARAVDFDSCLDVVTKLADAQRRVRDAAPGSPARDFEFRELLNLMEALAHLENTKRTSPSTREVTQDFLIETYAFLRSQPGLRPFLEASLTSDKTFAGLLRFAEKHKTRIEGLIRFYEQQAIAKTPNSSA